MATRSHVSRRSRVLGIIGCCLLLVGTRHAWVLLIIQSCLLPRFFTVFMADVHACGAAPDSPQNTVMRNMASRRAYRSIFEAASWFCSCRSQRRSCQDGKGRQTKLLVHHNAFHLLRSQVSIIQMRMDEHHQH